MDDFDQAEIEELLKLKQEELKALCRERSLKVSGNKTELARRLVIYDPSNYTERPTDKQLSYLKNLERKTGKRAPAKAYVSRQACTAAIDEFRKQ